MQHAFSFFFCIVSNFNITIYIDWHFQCMLEYTGSLTCVCDLLACVYTQRTLVYSLIQRTFVMSGQNLTGKMGGQVESLAENGHPYIWWSCMTVLNFGFRERALLLCTTDSPTLGLWLQLFWTATSGMSHSYSHKGYSNKITAWPALPSPRYMLIKILKNLTSCKFPPMGNGIYIIYICWS